MANTKARNGAGTVEHPRSSSLEQYDAELVAITLLSKELGIVLAPAKLSLDDDTRTLVHVDGFHEGPPAHIVEVFAHQGPLKPGQRHKVMSDVLKLVAIGGRYPRAKLLLVLTDTLAAADARRGWRGAAAKSLGVEVRTVTLPDDVAAAVRAAQQRQRMVNVTDEDC
ncbi:MAG: hypothetical protein KGL39_45435 [Patescibacteria group bacterium]|nr:hypothetical protein [Patescibacteria group bacterium]